PEDLSSIAALEAACFPAAGAADSAAFEQRIKTFPESFFVAEVEGQIIGMINGCVTDDETISDILFEDSSSGLACRIRMFIQNLPHLINAEISIHLC
ncbi:hypothetical protein NE464_22000, partial [Eubacterium callanderi]|nr:hypothetical protein [Eubacterium callanderi]